MTERISSTIQTFVATCLAREDELKALKSDLAALDRKISAEIAPKESMIKSGKYMVQYPIYLPFL